jgi:hypothetical protein
MNHSIGIARPPQSNASESFIFGASQVRVEKQAESACRSTIWEHELSNWRVSQDHEAIRSVDGVGA